MNLAIKSINILKHNATYLASISEVVSTQSELDEVEYKTGIKLKDGDKFMGLKVNLIK